MTFESFQVLLVPIAAGLIAQAMKLLTDGIKGNFDLHHLWASYGGMPSSHAAFVSALAAEVGFREGIDSTAFAIATVFALLIMRDALGLRMQLGHQGRAINEVIRRFHPEARDVVPPLEERIGHTPAQLIVGAIIGLAIVYIVEMIM